MGKTEDETPANSSLTYRPSIVTIIDILGFRSIVRDFEIRRIQNILKDAQRHAGTRAPNLAAGSAGEAGQTRCFFFSDSIVRVRPLHEHTRHDCLVSELRDLARAQSELLRQGVFIRGGMTIGDIHQDGDTIFGPAMARAHDLESLFANYPRIIIDPELFHSLRARKNLDAAAAQRAAAQIARLVRRGDDGLPYVDFLGAGLGDLTPAGDLRSFLSEVKREIVGQAQTAAGNLAVLQKHLWLATYFNSVATRDGAAPDLFITAHDIPDMIA